MRKYEVKKGKHDFSPITWPSFHRDVEGFTLTVQSNATCRYLLDGVDQMDWNKLFGLSYSWTSNKFNTVYTGFRYDPVTDMFEVAGYINDKGGKAWTKAVQVPIGEAVIIHARFLQDRIEYTFKVGAKEFVYPLPITFSTSGLGRKVGMWFGGNQVAPRTFHLHSTFNVW